MTIEMDTDNFKTNKFLNVYYMYILFLYTIKSLYLVFILLLLVTFI